MMLEQNMVVTYNISDRWFVLTVLFGVLNLLGILGAVGLAYLYKKKRVEHQKFRKHKEKWFKHDNQYEHSRRMLSSNPITDNFVIKEEDT